MLQLNSITFKDDTTGKIIEVNINNGHVSSDHTLTADEYAICSFHAGLLVAGGKKAIKEFSTHR